MLGDKDVAATLAVKDIGAAREFYEGTLGLALVADLAGGVLYRSGNSMVLVYESEFAGTNQATAASWSVDDVEGVMQALRDKGVTFEQYDLPGVTREGDVHIMGDLKGCGARKPSSACKSAPLKDVCELRTHTPSGRSFCSGSACATPTSAQAAVSAVGSAGAASAAAPPARFRPPLVR